METKTLAHVEIIQHIVPIKDNKSVEIAQILGWNVITKKGKYRVGEVIVYIEVDSELPNRKPFMFMKNKDFKVKTIYLKQLGMISQGLIFKLSDFEEELPTTIGSDLTNVLGIKRIEDCHVSGLEYQEFTLPYDNKRDTLTRIQSAPGLIAEGKSKNWSITEKLDGLYVTYILYRNGFKRFYIADQKGVLKTWRKNSVYKDVAKENCVHWRLRKLLRQNKKAKWVAIQCEIVGKGIKENFYELDKKRLFVFKYVDNTCLESCCQKGKDSVEKVNLTWVPTIAITKGLEIEEFIAAADGDSLVGNGIRKGIVLCNDDDISIEVISNKYLLNQK